MGLGVGYKFGLTNLLLIIILNLNGVLLQNICHHGLSTPGYTYPKGDIVIKYGDPLTITCVLHDDFVKKQGPNASLSLNFYRNSTAVPRKYIEVINSTSIRLHIDKPEKVSQESYMCQLEKGNGKHLVCMNVVAVGTSPQLVNDFECIGYNYDVLTCKWTLPENYVKTNYSLTYALKARANRRFNYNCPDIVYDYKRHIATCNWTVNTTPPYRQAQDMFIFNLTMQNQFGTNHINKTFMHFQHVLSGPPENLTVINTTSSSIYLYWMVPSSMQSFPKHVHHRVIYQCEYGPKKWHFGGYITGKNVMKEVYFNLTNLKYAHRLYDIRVSIRSADALENDEKMWSKNSSITVRTSSKLPDNPPKTNIGSFEILNNLNFREIFIYWQQIPEEEQNGADFTYIIKVDGNNTIKPINKTMTYAKFTNLPFSKNFTFLIWSKNEIGLSKKNSYIYVPSQYDKINEPYSFNKVEYGNGQYELNWEPPKLKYGEKITNYTIFWCSDIRDRPYPCNGKLNWTIISSNKTTHNESVPIDNKLIYQFAISANSNKSSSGMFWASCTILHSNNMGKMKNVNITTLGSTYIEIGWKLDCTDRIGSVEGFIIFYCPIQSIKQPQCKGNPKNVTYLGDAGVISGNITNLLPYTTYMLKVGVKTKHLSYSQLSEPHYSTTLEAAPSTPPINFIYNNITNSTIQLKWLPPPIKNGMLRKYIIKYNNNIKEIDGNINDTILENLNSYENYIITIEACTKQCSNPSDKLNVTTKIGRPGPIRQPSVVYQNDTFSRISWDAPKPRNGKNDIYEVKIKQKYYSENKTLPLYVTTNRTYALENCGDGGKYNTFYVSVRAVNKMDDEIYEGPWSDELESYCRAPINFMLYIVILMVIFFGIGMFYLIKKLYEYCKRMQNVEVKLPPGLAPAVSDHNLVWNSNKLQEELDRNSADEELLLEKINNDERRPQCADSGHESVTGSIESGTNLSNNSDSGTEQQPFNSKDLYYQQCGGIINDTTINTPTSLLYDGVIDIIVNNNIDNDDDDNNDNNINNKLKNDNDNDDKPYVPCNIPYVMTGDVSKLIKNDNNCLNDNKTTTTTTTPYISCDFTQSSPYVLTGDTTTINKSSIKVVNDPSTYITPYVLTGDVNGIKSVNPGYLPFNHEIIDKNSGYK